MVQAGRSRVRFKMRSLDFSIHTSMPEVGFEPTIPVFERAKTVHALDRVSTVIDTFESYGT
jgi:hypothetical protein